MLHCCSVFVITLPEKKPNNKNANLQWIGHDLSYFVKQTRPSLHAMIIMNIPSAYIKCVDSIMFITHKLSDNQPINKRNTDVPQDNTMQIYEDFVSGCFEKLFHLKLQKLSLRKNSNVNHSIFSS